MPTTSRRRAKATAVPPRAAVGAGRARAPASRAALTETLEDYLEIVYMLSRRHAAVRVRDIARAKSVRMPTVVIALRRLAERGLIRYAAGDCAQLTAVGAGRGRRLAERHVFLQRFLQEILGLPEAIAAKDACGLEHHLTPVTLERLAALVEHLDAGRGGAGRRRAAGRGTQLRTSRAPSRRFSNRAWSRRLGDETPAAKSRR
jgi:DtxR family Mn-dependent transcriptional regulator